MQQERERIYEYLSAALDIGEQMLESGAEVNRVEDTIARICKAYGAERVDVFTITSSIVVTIKGAAFGTVTQTRRIKNLNYNLNKLSLLNDLSRFVCAEKPLPQAIGERVDSIDRAPSYRFISQLMIYGLISAAFSVFFGGTANDAMASGLIGVIIRLLEEPMRRMNISRIFSCFVCAVAAGVLAVLAVRTGAAENADMISIGNIMLLIPGVALTNAIRDMFQGDTLAGLARFCEAIIMANIVVLGVTLASFLM